MENGDILKYNLYNNKFEIFKKDEKSRILQELLSLLVDSESSEKESENFDYIKNIVLIDEKIQTKSSTNLKSKNKKILSEYEMIKELYYKISKNYDKENEEYKNNLFSIENDSLLKIDYPCIISLNFVLISIIKIFIDKKQTEFEFNIQNLLQRNLRELKFLKHFQLNFLQDFETLKTIEIKLSHKKYDSSLNLDYILFFCIFFSLLFPSVLFINLSLNCETIDKIFYRERNPYRIVEKLSNKIGKKYEKILIANWIVSKLLTRQDCILNLVLTIHDSYAIELNETTASQFIFKNKDQEGFHSYDLGKFTYLDSFLNLDNLYCFTCNFNSLDSILFQKINLILIKNISIVSLSLDLFPKDAKFNIRKLYMNAKYFYDDKEEDQLHSENPDDDLFCDLISVSNLNVCLDNYFTKTNGKILKILFRRFNQNLKNLILILEAKIRKLKYLKISINPYRFLCNYDFFNSGIACFIFDIFKILSSPSNINFIELVEFELLSENLKFDFTKFREFEFDFNLSKVRINGISLNLKFWNSIKFDQFPNEFMNSLSLNKITAKDFTNFQKFLFNKLEQENEMILNNLIFLKISISLTLFYSAEEQNIFSKSVYDFFKYKLPFNLEEIKIVILNKIEMSFLLIILYNFKKYTHNILKRLNLEVNLSIEGYEKIKTDFKENFLEELKVNNSKRTKYITIETFRINNTSIYHLYQLLFAIKYSQNFFNKLKEETIKMKLTKYLFTRKNKRIEILISIN